MFDHNLRCFAFRPLSAGPAATCLVNAATCLVNAYHWLVYGAAGAVPTIDLSHIFDELAANISNIFQLCHHISTIKHNFDVSAPCFLWKAWQMFACVLYELSLSLQFVSTPLQSNGSLFLS